MRVFRWVSANEIPPALDLRLCGWRLAPPRGEHTRPGEPRAIAIAHCPSMDTMGWVRFLIVHAQETRRAILLAGVRHSDERAQLLRLGFGEVLGENPALSELEARATRLAETAGMLPRHRDIGELRLDLFARDGFSRGRPLGLHPREFALLWRLADTPGRPVGKSALLRDVWRLDRLPETNSLAVHVFRLRDKLRARGFGGLVRTTGDGGYLLDLPETAGASRVAQRQGAEIWRPAGRDGAGDDAQIAGKPTHDA